MNESRVGSRYAKSLLELAIERNVLDQVEKDMTYFLAVCDASPEFVRVMRNPIIPHPKKKAILEQLFKGKVNDLTMAMFVLITQKQREAFLVSMAHEFAALYRINKGIELAEVTTAYPLQDDQRAQFINLVTKKTGKKVELTETVKPSIMGGYILQIGDRMIDESIQRKLTRLKSKLNDNSYTPQL
ncbi:MAG: synthase subunit delta [Chitinophagaceae bacterium]|nr:synthase subunit delta [Chitinophagaceae bacterium]